MKRSTEVTGQKPTDAEGRLNELLTKAWRDTIRVKSDYARANAEIVGMAASLQLITTKVAASRFANSWHISQKGLTWLNEQEQ